MTTYHELVYSVMMGYIVDTDIDKKIAEIKLHEMSKPIKQRYLGWLLCSKTLVLFTAKKRKEYVDSLKLVETNSGWRLVKV